MATILNVEIFAVGTWNGMKFVESDLEEIAKNTNALIEKGRHKPPLKLGHSEAQILKGQSDGDPALGWIENLKAEGDKLLADFIDMPDIVFTAIQAKRFSTVSVEMRHMDELGWVLTATALLGADLPAVKSLKDLQAFLSENIIGKTEATEGMFYFSEIKPNILKGHNMPDETTKAVDNSDILKFQEELATLKAENQLLKAKQEEIKFAENKASILAPYKKDVEKGALAPSIIGKIEKHIDENKANFSSGNVSFSSELAREIGLAYTEKLPTGEAEAKTETDEISERIDAVIEKKAKELMLSHNISYIEACDKLFSTKPELLKEYKSLSDSYFLGTIN